MMKYKVGDRVEWLGRVNYKAKTMVGTVLGFDKLSPGRLHVRFDSYNYQDQSVYYGNLYDGRDYHAPREKDCVHVYNGLQKAIKKAKEL